MALHDPIAAYNAASNAEALFVRDALIAAGIEAFVIEDVSQAGTWMGGFIPEIHKPQVWIEREDIERAKAVLNEFERRVAVRNAPSIADETESWVEATCEGCGRKTAFPASVEGSVQECPKCGAYLDVGDAETEGFRE